MNGEIVGQLIYTNTRGLQFQYHNKWLDSEKSRPISLSLPLQEGLIKGVEVLHFFDNLLPDSQNIRNRIQAHFAAETNHCFDLLTYLGRDCVGALQLLTEEKPGDIKQVTSLALNEHDIAERASRVINMLDGKIHEDKKKK